MPPKLDRLPKDVEIALFRAVQGVFTNVHRHSVAPAVDICVRADPGQVHLEISDNGYGMTRLPSSGINGVLALVRATANTVDRNLRCRTDNGIRKPKHLKS